MKYIFTLIIASLLTTNIFAQSSNVIYKTSGAAAIAKDMTLTNPIKFDPNVVKDYLKVTIDPSLAEAKKTIAIYDILGRQVLVQIFEGADKQLFLQNLSRGLYFIRVDTPDIAIVSKFEVNQ
ncbi:MAG: Secretion system C-terminal sorting domain [Bacteroidota bacterium]|jgi:hypothetical protein